MTKRRVGFILVGVAAGAALSYYLRTRPSRHERDYINHMTNDLRMLDSLETAFKARNKRYTTHTDTALSFQWTTGVTPVTVITSPNGWRSTVKHEATSYTCTIAVGDKVESGEAGGKTTCRR